MNFRSLIAGAVLALGLVLGGALPSEATMTGATVGTTAAQVLAAPTVKPWYFVRIANESSGSTAIACVFGTATPALNSAGSYTIPAGGSMTWQAPGFSEMDPITCVAGALSTPVTIETH